MTTRVRRYQNVSILDFIGAKDGGGGGDSWSCKKCKAAVNKPTPNFYYKPDALPVAQQTV